MSSVYNTSNITPGCIYRIYLQNFVTYSEVELYPGTSLNLIIGPNGTGKSTFVSAIILGLCGKPHIIGRTNKVSDYIRSGSDKAVIEIELYQSPGKRNIIIRRTIIGELSKWYIDNIEVEERIVKELILKFKIQVDNLCQLLPQDKVHDFSKLNPQELLKSTLSAIDTESLDQLKTLIDNCKEKHDLKMRLTYIDNQLKKLQRENEGLKGNYEAMLERNEYEKEIKICKLKELWIEFNSLSLEINTYKEDKRSKENVLKSLESKLKKIEDDVKVHSDNMKRMNNERNNLTAIINELKNTTNLNINSIKSNEDEIRKAELTYKGILVRESNRGKAIKTEKVKLEKLKNDKTIFEKKEGNESELKKSLDNIALILNVKDRELKNNERKRYKIMQENSSNDLEIRGCEERIRNLEDMNNNRLRKLEKYSRDTFRAVQWFRENQNLFEQPVYEPMMLELQFADPYYAAHVESMVPNRDLLAFTFSCARDMNVFLRRVRAPPPGPALRAVGAVCAPPPAPAPPPEPLLSHLGFHAYLLDKVSAPDAVLRYLRALGLGRVPLGDRHTYEHAERVPLHVRSFFADKYKIVVRTSKYSGAVVRSTHELRPARLLADALDQGALSDARDRLSFLKEEEMRLKEKLRLADAQLSTLRTEYDKINEKKKNIEDNIENIKKLSAVINIQVQKIQSLNDQQSTETEKTSCNNKKKSAVLRQCELHTKLCKSFKELQKHILKRHLVRIKLSKCEEEENENNSKVRNCQNDVKETKNLLKNVEKNIMEQTMQANEKKQTLKQKCQNKLPNESGFPYKNEFAKLPRDLKKIQDHRIEIETKMGFISANTQEIEHFKKNLEEISQLEEELSRKHNEEEELKKSSERLKQTWLKGVESTIQKINESFSEMFQRVKCEGKVSLDKGTSEDEFDKYGIMIWVKFRAQSQLMKLTRDTQSGGERALSTALYLLALQRMARVPFRCVDEINQGMDEVNERKMLQLLIHCVTSENSQYFMLTPKLLPNIKYNERVTIHTIMNGKQIMDYKQWNYEEFVKEAKSRV